MDGPSGPPTMDNELSSLRGNARPTTSLAPVVLALVAAAASLLLTTFTLYPRGQEAPRPGRVVQASAAPAARRSALPNSGLVSDVAAREALSLPADPSSLGAAAIVSLVCIVQDEDGRGVAGAEVWADDGAYQHRGVTDAKGRFDLEFTAEAAQAFWSSGSGIEVGARHDDFGPSLMQPWSGPHEELLVLHLRGRGAQLVLQVVDTTGLPIPGAEVRVSAVEEGASAPLDHDGQPGRVTAGRPVTSDSWGEARLRGLEPGLARVSVLAREYCPRNLEVQLVEAEPTTRRVRLSGASSLRGRLTRSDGREVTCVRVTGVGDDPNYVVAVIADSWGSYHLRDLPAGRVVIHAECREGGEITLAASAELVLRPGEDRTHDLELTPVDRVSGRLVDAQGMPLVGWRLELQLEDAAQEPLHVTRTDEDGRYELPDSHAGRAAMLFLYHPQAAGGLPTRILSDPRRSAGEDELRLEPGEQRSSPLRGRLRDADGRPAVGVSFLLHRLGTSQNLSLVSGQDLGSFETSPLPPGDYILIFPNHGRTWIPDMRFHLGEGDALDIGSLSLPRLGWVDLAPSIPSRESECREIRLTLLRPQIGPDFTYPVLNGRVDLPIEFVLAPGQYALQATDVPGSERVDFVVSPASTTHIVVPCDDE